MKIPFLKLLIFSFILTNLIYAKESSNYSIGISLYKEKKFDKALPYLEKYFFTEKWDDYQKVHRCLRAMMEIYNRKNMLDEIIKAGVYYLEKTKDRKELFKNFVKYRVGSAYARKGNRFFWNKQYSQAIKNFVSATKYFPPQTNVWIYPRLGICYYEVNKVEEAKKVFIKCLKLSGKKWKIKLTSLYYLAKICDEKELEKIRNDFKDDAVINSFITCFNYIEKGEYEKAFQLIEKAEKKYNTKGNLTYLILKNTPLGEEYEKILLFLIRKFPANKKIKWAIFPLFRFYRRDKEKLNEIKEKIVSTLEEIINKSGNRMEAESAYSLLLDLKFRDFAETEENYEKQIKMCKDFIKRFPESKLADEILQKEARIYETLERYRDAIEIYKFLIEEKGKKNLLPKLSQLYFKNGDSEKAIELLERYIYENKSDLNAKLQLANLYLSIEEYSKGIKILNEIEKKSKEKWVKRHIQEILKNYKHFNISDDEISNFPYILFLEFTDRFYCFTNCISLKEDTPLISRKENEIEVYPFSKEKKIFKFTINAILKEKPSLTEPPAIFYSDEGFYKIFWKEEKNSLPDKWRKINSYRIIFPWKDTDCEGVEVDRIFKEKEGKATILIKFNLPAGKWNIEIPVGKISGRIKKITPPPDKGIKNLFYEGKYGKFQVRIDFDKPKWIQSYYPKVVIRRVIEERENLEGIFKNYEYGNGKIRFIFSIPESKIYTLRKKEIIYEIGERMG
ncbi:MAG: hypothetical protein DRP67_03440 [Candidatus Omnitrophota bacterium]|nr:MAG: hypothetical protein DRP67_03440 [Candidatus Omnitrophota bacterium]